MNAHTLRGEDIRAQARSGQLDGPTCGLAPGYLQANLVIVPEDLAFDFLSFCKRNPKPCPILDVTEPGAWEPSHVARGADIRTDLPRYRVYRRGVLVEEPSDIVDWWRDDLVVSCWGARSGSRPPCSALEYRQESRGLTRRSSGLLVRHSGGNSSRVVRRMSELMNNPDHCMLSWDDKLEGVVRYDPAVIQPPVPSLDPRPGWQGS